MSPAKDAAQLLQNFGVRSRRDPGQLFADRRSPDRAGGDRRP